MIAPTVAAIATGTDGKPLLAKAETITQAAITAAIQPQSNGRI
ncbi:hypothetical protein [Parerythrobacter lacustris]|nr:hypothetical protein [Parerythrobacter lacustris]